MRIPKSEIPSAFVRQDTRTNAADSFANVRDLQRAALNNNVLLARRARRVLISMRPCALGAATGRLPADVYAHLPAETRNATPIISVPVKLSPKVQEVTIAFRANSADADGNPISVYACLRWSGSHPEFYSSDSVSVVAGGEAKYSLTIPVAALAYKNGEGTLSIYADGKMTTSVLKAAVSVTAAGPDWVEAVFNQTATAHVLYFPTDATISPAQVTRYVANVGPSGTEDRCYVAQPFNKIPTPGVDTVELRNATQLSIYSLVAYEEQITTVGEEPTLFHF